MDAAAWDARYAGTELVWTAEPNRFVVEQTEHLAPGRALDLACGEGRNAVWLAERGWDVTAVDFSQQAVDKAKALAEHRDVHVEWVCDDIVGWQPADDARYDLALLSYLHLPPAERQLVMRTATLALRPGGRLVVVGHDRSNLTDGVGGPQDPAILLDAEELTAELAALASKPLAGKILDLRVERAGRVRRRVVVDGQERVAIDTLVTAVALHTDLPCAPRLPSRPGHG